LQAQPIEISVLLRVLHVTDI